MAFRRKDDVNFDNIRTVVIAASQTVYVGSAVYARTGGYAIPAGSTAMAALLGVVVDIVDKNGNSVFGSLAKVPNTTVSGTPDSGYVTTAASNTTTDKIAVKVDISPMTRYSVSVTGTIGTTTTSDVGIGWMQSADDRNVDETTHTRTITTGGTWFNWGTDPADSTRLIVSLAASEVFGPTKALA